MWVAGRGEHLQPSPVGPSRTAWELGEQHSWKGGRAEGVQGSHRASQSSYNLSAPGPAFSSLTRQASEEDTVLPLYGFMFQHFGAKYLFQTGEWGGRVSNNTKNILHVEKVFKFQIYLYCCQNFCYVSSHLD